jgi:hypothetical protein
MQKREKRSAQGKEERQEVQPAILRGGGYGIAKCAYRSKNKRQEKNVGMDRNKRQKVLIRRL